MNEETIKRFWSKVKKTPTCWLWMASKRNKGYGAFVWANEKGKIIQGRAHRFSWELHKGKISKNICVLHKCDVPACVNPDHLFLGTKADNNKDMCNKGRHRSGTSKTPVDLCKYKKNKKHWNYKIPFEIVKKIRESNKSFLKIAKEFNVSLTYVFKIKHNLIRKRG